MADLDLLRGQQAATHALGGVLLPLVEMRVLERKGGLGGETCEELPSGVGELAPRFIEDAEGTVHPVRRLEWHREHDGSRGTGVQPVGWGRGRLAALQSRGCC